MFIAFLFFVGFSIMLPRFTKYFIVAPILGFTAGGFLWSILAIFFHDVFANIRTFFSFIILGTIAFCFSFASK